MITLTWWEFWLFSSLLFSAGALFGMGWAARRREEELFETFRDRAVRDRTKDRDSVTTPVLRLSTHGAAGYTPRSPRTGDALPPPPQTASGEAKLSTRRIAHKK